MFAVKICGIQSLADALAVAEAGGDAIGFNFYPQTRRYVAPEMARSIAAELPSGILKVGVFVNELSGSIADTCRIVGLDCVQLHGDEPAALLRELPTSAAVIRAFRLAAGDLSAPLEYLRQCDCGGRPPDAVLVDSLVRGAYGGTGQTANWQELSAQRALLGDTPLILAGGLTPRNVQAAVVAVRPFGVDTASGVERSPGEKDPEKVRKFVAEARQALARISAGSGNGR